MSGVAPMPRFRLYSRAGDYAAFLKDLLLGRLTKGDDVDRLERAIATWCGMRYAVCVPQGRVGVYLAVKAAITPGQKVVLSPYTIADVINMVICAGGVPVFADIERCTTNIRPEEVERLIDDETGAVMVTHLHGMACDIEQIAAICGKKNIPLIEDAAQSFGARVRGRAVGAFGDVGVFSFGMYKNVTAFYGGIIVTDSDALHAAMRAELEHVPYMTRGMLFAKAAKALVTDVVTAPLLFKPLVYWLFRFGYLHGIHAINKYVTVELDTSRKSALPAAYLRRLLPAQARMVLRQLPKIDADAAMRIRYARMYCDGLRGLRGLIIPPFRDDGSHVYNYVPIQYSEREALVKWVMARGRDVAVQHLKNCASLPAFAPEYRDCPDAEATASQTILLPNYPAYGEEQVRRNIAVIRQFFERRA